jgi:hypothetical protein
MANTDAPFGLQPYQEVLRATYYKITNNYGTALGIFDPVVRVAAGTIEKAAAGNTNQILGSVLGIYKQYGAKTDRAEQLFPVQYFSATPGTTFDYWALVADHPDQIFLCQADNNGGSLTTAERYSNVDLIYTHSLNAYSGVSGVELNGSSSTSNITYQMTIIDLAPVYDPASYTFNTYGAFAKWLCTIQLHQLRTGRAGV